MTLPVAVATATLLFALLVGLVALDHAPVLLLAPYGWFSVVGFATYRAATKQPFRSIFWGTAIANCVALGWLLFNMPASLG